MTYRVVTAAAALVLLIPAAIGPSQAQMPGGGRERAAPNIQRAPNVQRAPMVQRAPNVQRRQAEPRVQRAPRNVERRQNTQQTRERAQVRQRERTRSVQQQRQRNEARKQAAPKKEQNTNRAAQQKNEQNRTVRGKDAPGNANQARNRGEGAQQVNRLAASNEQRAKVRDGIFKEKGLHRITRQEFGGRIGIGERVNRRHRLWRLTPALLAFAPIYYGYSYLVVDDEICIVDPETYYVVDIIPATGEYAGGSSGGSYRQLVLSPDEMHFIYASVPRDRTADMRVRLALGAEVPGGVDLQGFPGEVRDRVPQIQPYRYIVVENDVVIVDPEDRAVALVITE